MSKGELVPLADVRFPKVPSFPFTTYMPRVWRMDYGPQYEAMEAGRSDRERRTARSVRTR